VLLLLYAHLHIEATHFLIEVLHAYNVFLASFKPIRIRLRKEK